jgi:anti-sigma B factor antagonist
MEIKIEKCGKITFAIILGDHLDASNAKEFKQDMTEVIEDGMVAVLDMSELQFVDSSGLGAILSCLRHLNKREGDLLLCGMTKPVRILFELVRMHRVFEIFNTREEATRVLNQSA